MVFPQCQYTYAGWLFAAMFAEAGCYFPATGTALRQYVVTSTTPDWVKDVLCGSTLNSMKTARKGKGGRAVFIPIWPGRFHTRSCRKPNTRFQAQACGG